MTAKLSANQKFFNKTYRHLLKQGATSKLKNSRWCAYRGENGTRCAIGCHIPNKIYLPEMERSGFDAIKLNFSDVLPKIFFEIDDNLANRLQIIHDSYPPDEWEERLILAAKAFGLKVPTMVV